MDFLTLALLFSKGKVRYKSLGKVHPELRKEEIAKFKRENPHLEVLGSKYDGKKLSILLKKHKGGANK